MSLPTKVILWNPIAVFWVWEARLTSVRDPRNRLPPFAKSSPLVWVLLTEPVFSSPLTVEYARCCCSPFLVCLPLLWARSAAVGNAEIQVTGGQLLKCRVCVYQFRKVSSCSNVKARFQLWTQTVSQFRFPVSQLRSKRHHQSEEGALSEGDLCYPYSGSSQSRTFGFLSHTSSSRRKCRWLLSSSADR